VTKILERKSGELLSLLSTVTMTKKWYIVKSKLGHFKFPESSIFVPPNQNWIKSTDSYEKTYGLPKLTWVQFWEKGSHK
jgi:hypothetical protein